MAPRWMVGVPPLPTRSTSQLRPRGRNRRPRLPRVPWRPWAILSTYVPEKTTMAWVLKKITEEIYRGIPPHETECMTNDDGVRIIVAGRDMNGSQTVFIYEHGDMKFQFKAHRSSKNWVDYSTPGKKDWSNFALGPSCDVWLDTRYLSTRLLPDELNAIKANITEFLTKGFSRCRSAIAPHAEMIAKFY